MAYFTPKNGEQMLIENVVTCRSKAEAERILVNKGLTWTHSYSGGRHTFIFADNDTHIAVWFRLWKILEIR